MTSAIARRKGLVYAHQLPPRPESEFQAAVVDLARTLRWRVYHSWTSIRSADGFPDLVLVKHPRVIFAELKTKRGAFTPEQVAWLSELDLCPGVETYRWRDGQIEEIAHILTRGHR